MNMRMTMPNNLFFAHAVQKFSGEIADNIDNIDNIVVYQRVKPITTEQQLITSDNIFPP